MIIRSASKRLGIRSLVLLCVLIASLKAVLAFAPDAACAQGLLGRLRQTVEDAVETVRATTQTVDPRSHILREFSRHSGLEHASRLLTTRMEELERSLQCPLPETTLDGVGWRRPTSLNVNQSLLEFLGSRIEEVSSTEFLIDFEGCELRLVKIGDVILAMTPDGESSPLDDRLEAALMCVQSREIANHLRMTYFQRAREVADNVAQLSDGIASFCRVSCNVFDQIDSYRFMNVSATDILDPMVRSSTGISLREMESAIRTTGECCADISRTAGSMRQSCDEVREGFRLLQQPRVPEGASTRMLGGLSGFGDGVVHLASPMKDLRNQVAPLSKNLAILGNATDLGIIQTVSVTLVDMDRGIARIIDEIEQYGKGFRNVVESTRSNSVAEATKTRTAIKSCIQKRIEEEDAAVKDFAKAVEILEFIAKNRNLATNHSFQEVLQTRNRLMSAFNSIQSALAVDALAGIHAAEDYEGAVSEVRPEAISGCIEDLVAQVGNRRLLGQPNLDGINRNMKKLEASTGSVLCAGVLPLTMQIQELDTAVSKHNRMVMILGGLVALLIVGGVVGGLLRQRSSRALRVEHS